MAGGNFPAESQRSKVGETVTISGAAQPEYNGTFVITAVPLTTTFKYTITGNPSSATGTITSRRADDVYSNDILTMIKYPDTTTGSPSSAVTDQKSFVVDRLGENKTMADQNGTVHTYSYDSMSRLASDAATTLASGVNNSILRLTYLYEPLGNVYQATSYDAASGGTVKNQVQYTYNGLGQLITEYQAQSGAVNTGSSPKVQYTYTEMSGGANNSRLTKITYPNGRIVRYEYNSGVDSAISRVSFLADDSAGSVGTHLEEYSYLGLGTIVQENRPQPGTKLTYISQSSGTGAAGDQYTGLDRFGRVIDQNWYKASAAIDEYKYGYDADSNVLWKENMRSSTNSELYADQSGHFYDGLNRLQHFQRGTLSTGHDSIQGSAGKTQDWTLDQTGNATDVKTNGTDQYRGINQQNEITSITSLTTPGYDSDGNTTTDETNHALTYDAWNRLMTYGGSSETFTYDAMGRRITSVISSTTRHLYYSAQWQVVEERLNTSTNADTQYVWGLAYVDAMVLRDRDTNSDGILEERRYSQYDANYNVTGITDTSGNVKERYQYDPYGLVKILNGASDADSGVSDWSADANNTSDWGWIYLHQGGRYDSTTKLYNFRLRDYSPTLQRWMQEDPLGYIDGMNLYQSEESSPLIRLDPMGTDSDLKDLKQSQVQVTLGIKHIDGWIGKPEEDKEPFLTTEWIVNVKSLNNIPLGMGELDPTLILWPKINPKTKNRRLWIVQHVTIDIHIYSINGDEDKAAEADVLHHSKSKDGTHLEFWESWLIQPQGFFLEKFNAQAARKTQGTDEFRMGVKPRQGTIGMFEAVGAAQITDRDPALFNQKDSPVPASGEIPSGYNPPNAWRYPQKAPVHYLKYNWCYPGNKPSKLDAEMIP